MKKILLCIFILLISTNVFADKLHIPFSCYPLKLQEQFTKRGYKLDLNAEERTPESFGFIKSEGSSFWLYTYYPVNENDFETIKEIVWEHLDD